MSNNVVHLTNDNFEHIVTGTNQLVLVDFWAPWCGPCKNVGLIIEELADEYIGEVLVTKVNVDEAKEVTVKSGVRGIPALLIFREGKEIGRITSLTKSHITAELEGFL